MASRQQVVIQKKQENISNGLKKRIDAANAAASTAEEKVHIAYEYAITVDGLKPYEAAKVLKARLKYTPQWINKHLPDEAKHMTKSRMNQAKRKVQNFIMATAEPETVAALKQTSKSKMIIIPPKDAKYTAIIVPTERVKKFYSDLQKIKEKAEKDGLRIYSDASVEVLLHTT
jgi:hypothetical protein